jgi:hypothetical protein
MSPRTKNSPNKKIRTEKALVAYGISTPTCTSSSSELSSNWLDSSLGTPLTVLEDCDSKPIPTHQRASKINLTIPHIEPSSPMKVLRNSHHPFLIFSGFIDTSELIFDSSNRKILESHVRALQDSFKVSIDCNNNSPILVAIEDVDFINQKSRCCTGQPFKGLVLVNLFF